MQAAKDERILEKAFEENRIIVSADSNFGTLGGVISLIMGIPRLPQAR